MDASLLENKLKQVAFCKGGGERGCVWGQGWEKSLQGVQMPEGSPPGQGGGEQCRVTLVGTVGSGSETVASACCHFRHSHRRLTQGYRAGVLSALLPMW